LDGRELTRLHEPDAIFGDFPTSDDKGQVAPIRGPGQRADVGIIVAFPSLGEELGERGHIRAVGTGTVDARQVQVTTGVGGDVQVRVNRITGEERLRAKSAVSRSSVKPVLINPPLVVRAKARVSGCGGWKKTGGAAVTMGARVTRKATVGWRVAVAVGTPACGSTVAGMGETSAGGASAVMKVGVASSVGGGAVGSSAVGAGGCVGTGA